jgi:hypothetical protein
MRRLGRYSRALAAGASFAAFAGAFVTTPIVVRGAAEPQVTAMPVVRPIPAPSAVALILPRRDPFAGDEPRAVATTPSNGSAPAAAVPPPLSPFPGPAIPGAAMPGTALPGTAPSGLRIPATLGPLPPNAGAINAPPPFAAQTARVTAVVTGAHPYALVDDAGTTRIVTVGDHIASDAIAAITAGGVRLANGRMLTVAPASPMSPGSGGR